MLDLEVVVTSNTDALSALTVHDLFTRMVERTTDEGTDALRIFAAAASNGRYPDPDRGAMVAAVDSRYDGAETAEIGVHPVDAARARPHASFFESDPADYPLYRDQGTDPYGSPTGGAMRFLGQDGQPVYRTRVGGQDGAHFMLATYEEMTHAVVPQQIDVFRAELRAALS